MKSTRNPARHDAPDIPQADQAPGCPHPRETYDLIGHRDAEARFIEARKSGRFHHAWLITGPPGIGKATFAYRMIRSLLGGQPQLEDTLDIPPTDPIAQRVQSLGHGDFFLLRRPYDHKTKKLRAEIPIARTRDMNEFFTRKASEGGWRVCLVDNMDEMNRNAENGILKILEEPPDKAVIILLSSVPGRLLPTIRSRCLHLPLRAVPEDEIIPWLNMRTDVKEGLVQSAAALSRGAPGKALTLLHNADTVLKPLGNYMSSLGGSSNRADQQLSNSLSQQANKAARKLFWEALQDVLQAQAKYVVTGDWQGPFKPITMQRPPDAWETLWSRMHHLQNRESALNMDPKTVMQVALNEIRTV